jgi:hypothetical protein
MSGTPPAPSERIKVAVIGAAAVIAAAVIGVIGPWFHASPSGAEPPKSVPAQGTSVLVPTLTSEPSSSQPLASPPAPATTVAGAGENSADSWIAQLYSEPVSTGIASRDQRLAQVRADVPGAQVLRSDDFASLRTGYWVIYDPGPFSDGSAALAFCATHGRVSKDQCIGRFLSHHAADIQYQCFPPAASPHGDCKHS